MTATTWARHSCLAYDDLAVSSGWAQEFLGAGLAAGERIVFAASGGAGGMTDWLARAAIGDSRAVRFEPLDQAYGGADPEALVAAWAVATEAALADGYAGLRVFADCTPLVRTPEHLTSFSRYEGLIDRYMTTAPLRGICAFDRTELGDRTIAELACLHVATNVETVSFALCAEPDGGPGVVLSGELDPAMDDLFATALDRAWLGPDGDDIVLHGAGLTYVDHRSLLHLEHFAEQHDTRFRLRTRLGAAHRIAELVGLSRVQVEVLS